MLNKLTLAYKLLHSVSYVVLTDSTAVVHIPPMLDPEKVQNVVILGSQSASLKVFRDRLNEVIKEHEHATKLLLHRKRSTRNKV